MPLYEFVCERCLKVLEFIVPLEEFDKRVRCPYCKKEVKRLMSAVLFKIK